MSLTAAGANKALREAGYAERVVRTNGVYYFCDGESYMWYEACLNTCSLVNYTKEDILRERNHYANKYLNR